jgi:hypothetical protein
MRKVSAHGLGHLLPPYDEDEAPKKIPKPTISLFDFTGVERWQYDLWHRIVQAALGDTPEQVELDDLSGLWRPAVSRYAATTPNLLRWFKKHNAEKQYREQVRPFGFLIGLQSRLIGPGSKLLRPVSSYERDPEKAAEVCFDRDTGELVPRDYLKSYQEALAQYHLHPEAKFLDGDYVDNGVTRRRHIFATAVEHIGKEANRWEEQFHLGCDSDAQTEYGTAPEDQERILDVVRRAGEKFGQRALAKSAHVSLREVSTLFRSGHNIVPDGLAKLYRAIPRLEAAFLEKAEHTQDVLNEVRACCQKNSVRQLAACAEVDQANLTRILSGRRKPSEAILAKLELALTKFQDA